MAVIKREKTRFSQKENKIVTTIFYEVQYFVGTKRKSKSFKKKKDADDFDALKKVENIQGEVFENKKIIFNDFIDEWQNDTKKTRAIKTQENDNYLLERIREKLGFYELKQLTPRVLKDFYNYLEGLGSLSSETVYKHYKLINVLLNYAKTMLYIKSNPNYKLYKKKTDDKKEIETFTDVELCTLVNNLVNETIKYRALIQVAMDIIGRRGEVTGLEWEDIDWKTNTIYVHRETQAIKGLGIVEINRTKTNSSNRYVELQEETIIVLKEYKKWQDNLKANLGDKWGNSKKIFTTEDGRNMYPQTPYKILKKLEKKYGINENVSFHGGIRHSTYSWLLAQNEVSEYSKISKRGGHKDLSTTLRIYNHVINSDNNAILNSMKKMSELNVG